MKKLLIVALCLFTSVCFGEDVSNKLYGLWEIENFPANAGKKYLLIFEQRTNINSSNDIYDGFTYRQVDLSDYKAIDSHGRYSFISTKGLLFLRLVANGANGTLWDIGIIDFVAPTKIKISFLFSGNDFSSFQEWSWRDNTYDRQNSTFMQKEIIAVLKKPYK